MDRKNGKSGHGIMRIGDKNIEVIVARYDGTARLQLPGGGKIEAIINDKGQPELCLTGPLTIGDSSITSK